MKKRQIVLFCVGPDRCRKSSIIELLSQKLGVPSFKASDEHQVFMGGQDKFLMDLRYSDLRMLDFVKQTGTSVLYDRGYPCERVYSEFFERQTDHGVLAKLDTEYAALGAKILFCTRRSFAGVTDDLDKNIDESALVKLSSLYGVLCEWTQCPVMKVFVDEKKKRDIVKEVCKWL